MCTLLETFGRWIARRRGLAAVVATGLSLVAAASIAVRWADEPPIDFTPHALFADGGADVVRLRELERTFGREDNDFLVVLEGRLATSEFVAALQEAHATLLAHPRVERVDSLASVKLVERQITGLSVRGVFDDRSPADGLLAAAAEPALRGSLVAADGTLTILRARIAADVHRLADLRPVVRDLVERAGSVSWPAEVAASFSGIPFVRVEVVDLMLADQVRFLPVVSILLLLVSWFLFRRLSFGLAPLFGVWLSALWAIGLLVAIGQVFNLLSLLIPLLVVVIATSDGIHLAIRYREELAGGAGRELAMGSAVGRTGPTLLLTTLTTAAAFGSLAVAESGVVRAFGLQSAAAVLVALPAMLLGVPTWLAFAANPPTPRRRERSWTSSLATLVARRPAALVLIVLTFAGLALATGASVRTDSRLLELYASDHPTRLATRRVEAKLGGVIPLFLHLEGRPGAITQPAALDLMVEAEHRMQAAGAGWTWSPAAVVARVHELLGREGRRPDTRASIAAELRLPEQLTEGRLAEFITPDHAQARVIGLAVDGGGPRTAAARRELQRWAEDAFGPLGITATASGDGFVAASGLSQLLDDLLASVGAVFLVVFVVLLAVTRDLRLSVLAVVSNALPLAFTLGALGAMGRHIQPSNLVCFTVAIGLAIDDTLHFLARYGEALRAGTRPHEAVGAALRGAGESIFFTSVLLAAGFGVLITSEVQSTMVFGVLISVTLAAAAVVDLVLLPCLIHLFVPSELTASRGRASSS